MSRNIETVLRRSMLRLRHPCHLNIRLGAAQLPCRLIARPVPPEALAKRHQGLNARARRQKPPSACPLVLASWTLYVTNVPEALLSLQEAAILGGTRWQIECLFDLWKNEGRLDETRSQDPQRVLCELCQTAGAAAATLDDGGGMLAPVEPQFTSGDASPAEAMPVLQHLTAALQRTAEIMAQTCGHSTHDVSALASPFTGLKLVRMRCFYFPLITKQASASKHEQPAKSRLANKMVLTEWS